jgi:hypothetical protein
MNERIGKLRLQACKWASENVPIGEYENASDKKFAELIVRECAEVCDRAPFGNDYYANRIKEHFGVK